MTHIRDPCQFMIQRVADLEQLQIMMNVINIYCDSTENVHDLLYDVKFGMFVFFAPLITNISAESCAAAALKIFGKVDTSKLFLSILIFLFLLLSGHMCCAQFTTDNQWYRARIKTAYSPAHPNTVPTLENNLCVEVQYIDYGNSEWLPLSR